MEALDSNCINKLLDTELVAAAKCGNTEAFGQLVLRYQRRALMLSQRILNNREDAEDAVQESLRKAFLHINSFQEKSRFSTWLTRIAINEAFMVLRRRRRSLEIPSESAEDGAESIVATFVDQRSDPEQSCCHQERTESLTKAIDRLSPNLRKTVVLHDIEEHSVKETAQILGASIAAVKSRLHHGHEKLRGTLNPGYQLRINAAASREARC